MGLNGRRASQAIVGHYARSITRSRGYLPYVTPEACFQHDGAAWRAAFHLVITLPEQVADIAHQNKREIYNLLTRASADTLFRIAADPKHLGANVGITSVHHN